jgi:hypothetical protein
MKTPLPVRFAAFCASVVITTALVQSIALLGHPRHASDTHVAQTSSPVAPTRGAGEEVEDLLGYKTYAPPGAALAATAAASWRRSDVQRAPPPADTAYLPARFVEEERAAPIEPLPPQF